MSGRFEKMIPWVLACLIAAVNLGHLSLESFTIDEDAARHVLNGTLIHDYLRSGRPTNPLAFARDYYSRFPAISIPYHPPLFPAVEAASFAALGVTPLAARLPVAIAAGLCGVLIYRLVRHTHGSTWLAVSAALGFSVLPLPHELASDVMLELPSLALALGALYCLRDLDGGFPPSRAIPFAILASAAVWTKQHAVFVVLVPFVLIVLRRDWRLLRQPTLWAACFFIGLAVLTLLKLPVPSRKLTLTGQISEATSLWGTIEYNILWYCRNYRFGNGRIASIFAAAAVAAFIALPQLRRRRESHLYLAWIASLVALLLPLSLHDIRYTVYAMPAALVLIFDAVGLASSRILPSPKVAVAGGLIAACWVAYHASIWTPRYADTSHLRAARDIVERHSERVVCCGTNAMLCKVILFLRMIEPGSRTIVIRGFWLDPTDFTATGFETFARRYGVNTVVIEPAKLPKPFTGKRFDAPWNILAAEPAPSMVLTEVIPPAPKESYDISVYSIKDPNRTAERFVRY